MLVTEATTSKIQKAEKIPMNESTENFKNFARPRRGDRHFQEAAVHTNVQGNPDPEPRLAQGAAGEDGWRRGRAGAGARPQSSNPTPCALSIPAQGLTLHLSSCNDVSGRDAGHIDQVDGTVSLNTETWREGESITPQT